MNTMTSESRIANREKQQPLPTIEQSRINGARRHTLADSLIPKISEGIESLLALRSMRSLMAWQEWQVDTCARCCWLCAGLTIGGCVVSTDPGETQSLPRSRSLTKRPRECVGSCATCCTDAGFPYSDEGCQALHHEHMFQHFPGTDFPRRQARHSGRQTLSGRDRTDWRRLPGRPRRRAPDLRLRLAIQRHGA